MKDRYAVAVVHKKHVGSDGATVGHLPQKISCVCSLFIRRGGNIKCEITGRRRHSSDLPQGGLEIPCLLIMQGKKSEIAKIKNRFQQ